MPSNCIILSPVIAGALLCGSTLHAGLATWSPVDPTYQLVMQYRADAYVLDHDPTKDDCADALAFGDNLKHSHFSCEQEG